jgi:hypothetical protein
MMEYILMNRFTERYETGGGDEIEEGANFDGRELCVEEERMGERERGRRSTHEGRAPVRMTPYYTCRAPASLSPYNMS